MTLSLAAAAWTDHGHTRLHEVSLTVTPGRIHAVLGPNGAGKSSVVRLLAGDRAPSRGQARLDDRPLIEWDRQALARRRAVLLQDDTLQFPFRVEEVVALGRLPHHPESDAVERYRIDAALNATAAAAFRGRRFTTLSGGERQRVRLARALLQVWPEDDVSRYLLLDEPTSALDLAHQHDCLAMLRERTQHQIGVLVVLHDPNLALAYADTVTLLCCGEQVAQGPPDEVLTPTALSRVFGIRARVMTRADGRPQLLIDGR